MATLSRPVGGIIAFPDGTLALGPPVEETFWQESDIAKYWPPGETLVLLNAIGYAPFSSFTDYVSALCRHYCHAIQIHDSLKPFRDMVPTISQFIKRIKAAESRIVLNATEYVMSHKMYFSNIMCDSRSVRITAMLNWQFSGVFPTCLWDPSRAFLGNGLNDEASVLEKSELSKVFAMVCEEKGLSHLVQETKPNMEQQMMLNCHVLYSRHCRGLPKEAEEGGGCCDMEGGGTGRYVIL